MESRLEEVTRRLKETEKFLDGVYKEEGLQEKHEKRENQKSASIFGFSNKSGKTKMHHLMKESAAEAESDPLRKQSKPFFDLNSNVKYEENTPSGSELNFEPDKLIASTPKNNDGKKDRKMRENILNERILDLQSELQTQDQILRDAEERFERAQQETADAFQEKECLRELVADLTRELTEVKQLRKREKEDIRKHFAEYQMNSQEKNHLIESKLFAVDAERAELLKNVDSLQTKLKKISEEANWMQIENSELIEEQDRLKEENVLLKSKLSTAKKSVAFNEVASSELEDVEQRNDQLECQLKRKAELLKQFEAERDEIKTAFLQYVHLLEDAGTEGGHQVSIDSGNLSWKNDSKVQASKMALASDFEALAKISFPDACYSILTDFRSRFTAKDSLIQQMKSKIESLEESLQQKEGTESLQIELHQMTNRCLAGEQKLQELTGSHECLRQEVNRLEANADTLKFQLAECEAKSDKLDFCIGQRNAQLIELQEEINKKCSEVCQLERKLRKKSCEVTSLEQQLEEKVTDFSGHLTKYKGIEDQIRSYEDQLDRSTKECTILKTALEKMEREKEKLIQCHSAKLEEQNKQIELLQGNVRNQEELNRNLSEQIDALSQEVHIKTAELQDMELERNQAIQKLTEKSEHLEDVKLQLNFQSTESKGRANQMEMSINYLKAEIARNLQDMKENKKLLTDQITQHEQKEKTLLNQLKVLRLSVRDKEEECVGLRQTLQQNELMLEQSNRHISDLEESQALADKKMSKLEQHLLVERSKQLELIHSLKQKSDHFQQVATDEERQIQRLNENIQELQTLKMSLSEQLAENNNKLQEEQEEKMRATASLGFMKEQYEQTSAELEQLRNTVSHLEDHVKAQNEEIKTLNRENRELNKSVALFKVKVDEQKVFKEKLQHHILDLEASLKAKEEICRDLGEAIKNLQNEIMLKNDTVEGLQKNLEEQQNELDNRAAKVSELVATMSEYQKEMEGRVSNLENHLKTTENDIKERTEQIRNYKEQNEMTSLELEDKTSLLEHADQTCHKLQLELTEKKSTVQTLTQTIQNLKEQEKESTRNKSETTQELRLTRERLQSQTNDFILVRHQLEQLRHEHDKLARQLDNMAVTISNKETNISQLVEKLNTMRVEKVQTETRMSAKIKQLQQELKMEQQAHAMELERLKETQVLLQANKDELCGLLNETNQQKLKNGTKHEQEMNSVKASLHLLQDELKVQKDSVTSLNEQLVLKDVALSKLQSDLKSYETKFLQMRILQLEQNTVHQPKNGSVFPTDSVANMSEKHFTGVSSAKTEQSSNLLETTCTEIPQDDLQFNVSSRLGDPQMFGDIQVQPERVPHEPDVTGPMFEKIKKMLVNLTGGLPQHEGSVGSVLSPSMAATTTPEISAAPSIDPSSLDLTNLDLDPHAKKSDEDSKCFVPLFSQKIETLHEKPPRKSDFPTTFELYNQRSTLMKSPGDFPDNRETYIQHLQQRISANEQLQGEIDVQLQKLQRTTEQEENKKL